jgi:hypothetical protein
LLPIIGRSPAAARCHYESAVPPSLNPRELLKISTICVHLWVKIGFWNFRAFKEILWPCGERIFGFWQVAPTIGLSRNEAKNQKDRWSNYPKRTAIAFLKMP